MRSKYSGALYSNLFIHSEIWIENHLYIRYFSKQYRYSNDYQKKAPSIRVFACCTVIKIKQTYTHVLSHTHAQFNFPFYQKSALLYLNLMTKSKSGSVSHSVIVDSATAWTVTRQVSLSIEFSRSENSLFSRRSSQPRDQTQVSYIAGRFFPSWATMEAQEYWSG